MQFHFPKYFNSIITLFTSLTVLSCKSVKEATIVPDNSLLNNADWGIDTSLFFSQNYGFSQSNIYLSRSSNTYIPLHSPEIVETGYFKYLLYPKDHLLLHLDRNYKRMFISADIKESAFVSKYNIQTIPRFILVGKDGKIISDDAPRPSDKALQELIEKNQ